MERKYVLILLVIAVAFAVNYFSNRNTAYDFQRTLEKQGGEVTGFPIKGQGPVQRQPSATATQPNHVNQLITAFQKGATNPGPFARKYSSKLAGKAVKSTKKTSNHIALLKDAFTVFKTTGMQPYATNKDASRFAQELMRR